MLIFAEKVLRCWVASPRSGSISVVRNSSSRSSASPEPMLRRRKKAIARIGTSDSDVW